MPVSLIRVAGLNVNKNWFKAISNCSNRLKEFRNWIFPLLVIRLLDRSVGNVKLLYHTFRSQFVFLDPYLVKVGQERRI